MSHHLALPKGASKKITGNWIVLEQKNGQYFVPGKKTPVNAEDYETIIDSDLVEQFFSLATQNSLLKSIVGAKNGSSSNN